LKKQNAYILILILTINIICSCQSYKGTLNSNEIIEISSWNRCGDKGGGFYSLKITKDSIIRISGNRISVTDTLKKKTELTNWRKIIKLLENNDFSSFKSEKFDPRQLGALVSDGCISGASIKTNDSIFPINKLVLNQMIDESEILTEFKTKTSR